MAIKKQKSRRGRRVKGKRRKRVGESKLKNTTEKKHIGDKKKQKTTEMKIIYDIKKVMKHPLQVKQRIHPQFYFNVVYRQMWAITKYK